MSVIEDKSTDNTQISKKSSSSRGFLAGVCGATVGVLVTCPLEVIKTRTQSTLHKSLGIKGIATSMVDIVRTEGLRSLWKGGFLMTLSVVPSRGLNFLVYGSTKEYLSSKPKFSLYPSVIATLSSVLAGATAFTIMNPLWVIKTRFQLQTNTQTSGPAASSNYRSIKDAIINIHHKEGFQGFFKGIFVSYIGLSETAIQFTTYDYIKRLMAANNGDKPPSKLSLFLNAAFSKLIATTATYPHEVWRTRVREVRSDGTKPRMWSEFKNMCKEGRRGLYAGYEAHVLKTVPNAAIMFVIVEYVLDNRL